mmetsp:Transcript_28226/g.57262  ORF Transcript_28226/g.57262 Transcript_28226/m.57262 type:complete len:82 (-) Transcript_28226:7-252(-)
MGWKLPPRFHCPASAKQLFSVRSRNSSGGGLQDYLRFVRIMQRTGETFAVFHSLGRAWASDRAGKPGSCDEENKGSMRIRP